MKKFIYLAAILTSFASHTFAQQKYAVKLGANYNAEIVEHKLGKTTYPSYEAYIERIIGNHFSASLGFNYAKREYVIGNEESFFYFGYHKTFINYDKIILVAARYYPQSNAKGIFIEAGIPMIFTEEKTVYGATEDSHAFTQSYFAMNAFAGFGLKYPLSSRIGMEMSMTISPSFDFIDEDYGSAGFIKSGAKVFYTF